MPVRAFAAQAAARLSIPKAVLRYRRNTYTLAVARKILDHDLPIVMMRFQGEEQFKALSYLIKELCKCLRAQQDTPYDEHELQERVRSLALSEYSSQELTFTSLSMIEPAKMALLLAASQQKSRVLGRQRRRTGEKTLQVAIRVGLQCTIHSDQESLNQDPCGVANLLASVVSAIGFKETVKLFTPSNQQEFTNYIRDLEFSLKQNSIFTAQEQQMWVQRFFSRLRDVRLVDQRL